VSNEPEIRIGTPEREAAQQELHEHFSNGRLDTSEFEERSSLVAAARTHGKLDEIFQDLPRASARRDVAPVAPQPGVRPWRYGLLAISPFVALALFFVLSSLDVDNSWLAFLLVPAVGALLGGQYGSERRNRDDRRPDRRA